MITTLLYIAVFLLVIGISIYCAALEMEGRIGRAILAFTAGIIVCTTLILTFRDECKRADRLINNVDCNCK
jgi:hypothetical protein